VREVLGEVHAYDEFEIKDSEADSGSKDKHSDQEKEPIDRIKVNV
jgi:hypothetical protein